MRLAQANPYIAQNVHSPNNYSSTSDTSKDQPFYIQTSCADLARHDQAAVAVDIV